MLNNREKRIIKKVSGMKEGKTYSIKTKEGNRVTVRPLEGGKHYVVIKRNIKYAEHSLIGTYMKIDNKRKLSLYFEPWSSKGKIETFGATVTSIKRTKSIREIMDMNKRIKESASKRVNTNGSYFM